MVLTRAVATDGVRLHVESTGSSTPVLFIHEFAGDHRSWEPQVRELSRAYRCITYAARGYPPSDVPDRLDQYSQATAVSDAVAVLDAVGVEQAHVVGISMGGFCALHLGLDHPDRCRSLVVAGCGYGSQPERVASFTAESEVIAAAFERDGAGVVSDRYAEGPARVQFQNKNPRGWAEFKRALAGLSRMGTAMTMRGVQARRPSLYDLRPRLAALEVPTLLVTGDEDEGCLEPNLMLKRTIPSAGLAVLPQTGHTLNLEEPSVFNDLLRRFLADVEQGAWRRRDPRSIAASTTGMTD